MGWVPFTCCCGPVLKREPRPIGVCVSPCRIKQKPFDEDSVKIGINNEALKPSVITKLLDIK